MAPGGDRLAGLGVLVWWKDRRDPASRDGVTALAGVESIRTRIPIAIIAPRLQAAILDAQQAFDLSVAQLLRDDIPPDWTEQAKLFALG